MRTIKFRAWVQDENKMFYPGKDRNYYINIEGGLFRVGKLSDTKQTVTIPETKSELMQFTGLLDKNGKEIYEGDIVKDGETIGEIKYRPGCFSFEYFSDGKICKWGMGYGEHKNFEIIGNIYENSDLLSNK